MSANSTPHHRRTTQPGGYRPVFLLGTAHEAILRPGCDPSLVSSEHCSGEANHACNADTSSAPFIRVIQRLKLWITSWISWIERCHRANAQAAHVLWVGSA